jgi:hypothetical protein
MSKQVTSAHISGQIAALNASLTEYEEISSELSFAAVSGDKGAVDRLAETTAKIDQALADRKVLEQAAATARAKEAKASEAAEVERRAKALDEARATAGKLVEKAKQVDRAIAELKAILPELTTLENSIWTALRSAKVQPPGEFVGRKGLSVHAIFALQALASGNRFSTDDRSVADMAKLGWKFLEAE